MIIESYKKCFKHKNKNRNFPLVLYVKVSEKVILHDVLRRELEVRSAPALHWLCESDRSARPSKEKSPESCFRHIPNCLLMLFLGARCPPEFTTTNNQLCKLKVSFVNMCKSLRNVNGTQARSTLRGPGCLTISFYRFNNNNSIRARRGKPLSPSPNSYPRSPRPRTLTPALPAPRTLTPGGGGTLIRDL